MTNQPTSETVDEILDAFGLLWEEYRVWIVGEQWRAYAADGEMISGDSPGALNLALRLDWSKRNPEPGRGPAGMGPS
jgi:hypothetical protein